MKVNPNCLIWRVGFTLDGNEIKYRDKFTYGDAQKFQQDMEDIGADTQMFQVRLCDSYLYDELVNRL